MHDVRQILERLQARGVDSGHVPQTQNHDRRQVWNAIDDHIDFVGGAEEKRPVNAENGHVRRNFLVLQNVRVAFLQIFVRSPRRRWWSRDFADENEGGQYHSGFDRHGEVGENGEKESDQPRADLKPRQLQQLRNFAPLAHVVGNHQQNRGEHSQAEQIARAARRTG